MPILKYLADTNIISDSLREQRPVLDWLEEHPDEVAISTFVLAEIRRGIELKQEGKARRDLQRKFRYILEDFREAIFVFDEAAAMEWGRLMAEARNHPIRFEDSCVGAIARSMGMKMLTRNVRHFPGCVTIDPWTGCEHPVWRPT